MKNLFSQFLIIISVSSLCIASEHNQCLKKLSESVTDVDLLSSVVETYLSEARLFVLRNQIALYPAVVDLSSKDMDVFLDIHHNAQDATQADEKDKAEYSSFCSGTSSSKFHPISKEQEKNFEAMIGKAIGDGELILTRYNTKKPLSRLSKEANMQLKKLSLKQLEFIASLAKKPVPKFNWYAQQPIYLTPDERRTYHSLDQKIRERLANNYSWIDFMESLDDRIELLQNAFWKYISKLWCKK